MLSDNWRITIRNETGVTIDASLITIKYRGKYISSSGVLVYGGESGDVANQGSTITDGSYNTGTTVDNGAETNPYLEADVHIDCALSTNTATPSGDVVFYLQRSTADTPAWPTNGEGDEQIGLLNFTSKTDKDLIVTVG